MNPADQAVWIEAMKEELRSFGKREVYDEVIAAELHKRYWSRGIHTNKVPAICFLVKKPLHDGKGGWKAKSR
eukprot:11211090-Lingulodinium_polyedra.AAC.1